MFWIKLLPYWDKLEFTTYRIDDTFLWWFPRSSAISIIGLYFLGFADIGGLVSFTRYGSGGTFRGGRVGAGWLWGRVVSGALLSACRVGILRDAGSADFVQGSLSSIHSPDIYFHIIWVIRWVMADVLSWVVEPGPTVLEVVWSRVHFYALYYY